MFPSPSPSTSAKPSKAKRRKPPSRLILEALPCLCLLALSASTPRAHATRLVQLDDLPQGVEWAMGEEFATMNRVGGWRLYERANDKSEEDARTSSSVTSTRISHSHSRTTSSCSKDASATSTLASVQLAASGQDSAATTWSATSVLTSGSLTIATTTVTKTTTGTAAVSTSTNVPAGYTIPEAFDETLGTNFTSTACPSFFQTFLADPTFIACAPFSLLLATSTAFFTAERSPYSLLPYVLDASCSASTKACSNLMSQLATRIRLFNTCGPDLTKQNPLVVEALEGFQNYEMMREAGCQRNNVTGQYCFAEANAQSSPSELYFYYLPQGTSLPSGTTTNCESCTRGLLSIYAAYATNQTLVISKTYAAGRSIAVLACGRPYAPLVTAATSKGSRSLGVPFMISTTVAGLVLMLGSW